MEASKVDMFLASHGDYFIPSQALILKEKLLEADDRKFTYVSMADLKNPTTILIVSLLLGGIGVDRFMLGETGMGVLKLLTGGVCGILTIVDWFTCMRKAKEKNFQTIMQMLN